MKYVKSINKKNLADILQSTSKTDNLFDDDGEKQTEYAHQKLSEKHISLFFSKQHTMQTSFHLVDCRHARQS